jgi:hypothetical protein
MAAEHKFEEKYFMKQICAQNHMGTLKLSSAKDTN